MAIAPYHYTRGSNFFVGVSYPEAGAALSYQELYIFLSSINKSVRCILKQDFVIVSWLDKTLRSISKLFAASRGRICFDDNLYSKQAARNPSWTQIQSRRLGSTRPRNGTPRAQRLRASRSIMLQMGAAAEPGSMQAYLQAEFGTVSSYRSYVLIVWLW